MPRWRLRIPDSVVSDCLPLNEPQAAATPFIFTVSGCYVIYGGLVFFFSLSSGSLAELEYKGLIQVDSVSASEIE